MCVSMNLICIIVEMQSSLTLGNPTDCSLLGSSVHGILQARILKCITIPFSRGSCPSRDQTHFSCVSCIGRWVLYHQRHLGSLIVQLVQFFTKDFLCLLRRHPPSPTHPASVAGRIMIHFCFLILVALGYLLTFYIWYTTFILKILFTVVGISLTPLLCRSFVFCVLYLFIDLLCYQEEWTTFSSSFLRKRIWEISFLRPCVSENCHFIFLCLIDSLARYTRLGWKSFYFRILKALYSLLAYVTTEKFKAILIFDFFLSMEACRICYYFPGFLKFHFNSLILIYLLLFPGIHQSLSVQQLLSFNPEIFLK